MNANDILIYFMIFIFRFNIAKVPLFSKIVLLPKMHNALIENSGIAMASGLAKTGFALKQNGARCERNLVALIG